MTTPASIKGHPLHTILVALPVGLWVFALVADLAAVSTGRPGVDDGRVLLHRRRRRGQRCWRRCQASSISSRCPKGRHASSASGTWS